MGYEMNGRKPTEKELDIIMKSSESSNVLSRKIGLSPSTICRYRQHLGYKIDYKIKGAAIQKDIYLAEVDKTNPIDKYLYG